jgi:ABC-type uncharacterized transport system substrate-binding protein
LLNPSQSLTSAPGGAHAQALWPGGDVTGVVTLNVDTGQKRLELIHELLPAATTVGLLLNPTNAVAEIQSKELQAAARTLGLQLRITNASTERDLIRAPVDSEQFRSVPRTCRCFRGRLSVR